MNQTVWWPNLWPFYYTWLMRVSERVDNGEEEGGEGAGRRSESQGPSVPHCSCGGRPEREADLGPGHKGTQCLAETP